MSRGWRWNFSNCGSGAECLLDYNSGYWFPHDWCIREVICLHSFINLLNKYALSSSTGRLYFVHVWTKQVDWLCINPLTPNPGALALSMYNVPCFMKVLNFDFCLGSLTWNSFCIGSIFLFVYVRFTSNLSLFLNTGWNKIDRLLWVCKT